MLKIVMRDRDADATVLHLEGKIVGPWVDELEQTCDRLLATRPVALDLAAVSFVERRGVHLIRALGTRGVPVLHCSPLVAEQLKG